MYFEQLKTFFNGALSPRGRNWIESFHVFRFLMTDVRETFLDQHFAPLIQLLKVVRRVRNGIRFVTYRKMFNINFSDATSTNFRLITVRY